MFADGLDEFDDAREIVEGLAEEYAACESPDYIKWASGKENERMPGEGSSTRGGRRLTIERVRVARLCVYDAKRKFDNRFNVLYFALM
jgi:hypothetical protein